MDGLAVDALTAEEARVVEAVASRREDLVDLAAQLIALDTTARRGAEPARDEAAAQELIAGRLRAIGADADVWEPVPADVAGHAQVPDGLAFDGRPQLIATLPGRSDDLRLLLNGHIDAVPVEPLDAWTTHPFAPEVRDGKLHGRGSCDMKGGVAAIVIAVETLARLGVQAPATLVVNTVTDEESCGAGTLASLEHGLTADAAIIPEPTDFSVVVACRGILNLTVTVAGRPAHATMHQPDWRAGGAVNAIEKAAIVLRSLQALREDWGRRPDLRHVHLPPPTIVPTLIEGGEWKVSYPASCSVFAGIAYLPIQVDDDGAGQQVRDEIASWIRDGVRHDPWLAAHPPTLEWSLDMPPGEVALGEQIVRCASGALEALRGRSQPGGLDAWHDAASLIRVGGIPTVDIGPPSKDADGRPLMHVVDEHVEIDSLVATAQALALTALRFGTSG